MDKQQHTIGHVECPACEGAKRAMMYSAQYSEYLFPDAARVWLDTRKQISANTRIHYESYIKSLSEFFGAMKLKDIRVENVLAYQTERQSKIRASVQHQAVNRGRLQEESDGASRINHEISCVLSPVLQQAGLWSEIQKFYQPLPLPPEIGIALTREEEDHLFKVGSSRPRWMVAYCCDLLTRNTTASPGEIRYLRVRDIDLEHDALHIEKGVKNPFRVRTVPLIGDARWAVERLLDRYHGMCKRYDITPDADHYVLYHRASRVGAIPEPYQPMGSWKKAHYAMRREAAKKFPRLAQLRRYDLRHTACTDMLEDPSISYTTIEHMMGHRIGSKVKRKYDHLRDASLRSAAEVLDRRHAIGEIPTSPSATGIQNPDLADLAKVLASALLQACGSAAGPGKKQPGSVGEGRTAAVSS